MLRIIKSFHLFDSLWPWCIGSDQNKRAALYACSSCFVTHISKAIHLKLKVQFPNAELSWFGLLVVLLKGQAE